MCWRHTEHGCALREVDLILSFSENRNRVSSVHVTTAPVAAKEVNEMVKEIGYRWGVSGKTQGVNRTNGRIDFDKSYHRLEQTTQWETMRRGPCDKGLNSSFVIFL